MTSNRPTKKKRHGCFYHRPIVFLPLDRCLLASQRCESCADAFSTWFYCPYLVLIWRPMLAPRGVETDILMVFEFTEGKYSHSIVHGVHVPFVTSTQQCLHCNMSAPVLLLLMSLLPHLPLLPLRAPFRSDAATSACSGRRMGRAKGWCGPGWGGLGCCGAGWGGVGWAGGRAIGR